MKAVRAADEAAQDQPDLERVIEALEQSDRAPVEFATPALQPGQWVRFHCRLKQRVFNDDYVGSAVLFLQPAGEAARARLLLHGALCEPINEAP